MLDPTTRPTGSKPAFSTHRYSFTERSEVNSPRAFILRRSLACSASPSVLVGSYADIDCSPEVMMTGRLGSLVGGRQGSLIAGRPGSLVGGRQGSLIAGRL